MQLVPCIIKNDTELMQKIDEQWSSLRYQNFVLENWISDEKNNQKPVSELWLHLKKKKNICGVEEYKELANFVLDISVYLISSVSCERIFSKFGLIKTPIRNQIINTTMSGLLLTSQCVNESDSVFQPTKKMLSHMTASNIYKKSECE